MKYFSFMIVLKFVFAQIALGQETLNLETVIQRGHLKYVSCAAFSPDGKYIVTGSLDNTIKLWSITTGKEIRSYNRHTEKVHSVIFSPDGSHLLSASADNTAIIYDVLSGKVEHILPTTDHNLQKAIFSPDGSKVLTANNRDQTLLWDAKTGSLLNEYKKAFAGDIYADWFSPDSKSLLSYQDYNSAKLSSLDKEVDSLYLPFDKPYSFSFSKNGKYIALGSAKLFASLFDAKTGKLLHHLKADEKERCDGCNNKVLFSNNSKYLLTASSNEGVILWSCSSGKILKKFKGSKRRTQYMRFSPNNQYLLLKGSDEIVVYDVKTGVQKLRVESEFIDYFDASFSPNSQFILLPDEFNTCSMWNVSTGRKEHTFKGYLNQKKTDGLAYQYTNWTQVHILKYLSMKNNIAISPDGKYLVKGKIDSVALLINIETGQVEKTLKGHRKVVYAFDFSPDGKLLLTAGGDRFIKIWDVATGKEVKTIGQHQDLLFDAKFSADGKRIVTGSWDGSIRVWNLASGQQLQYIKMKEYSPYVVDFTPNDLYVVSGDLEKSIDFWEVDAGEKFRNMVGHTDVLTSFAFNSNGTKMVSGSWDGKVKVWDVLTGMLLQKYQHDAGVNSVAYHPKGNFIASASSDRTIKLWNPSTSKELKILKGHLNAVSSIQFTPDGSRLISCSVDGVIKVWNLTNYEEEYTQILIGRNDWLIKTASGYFDGSAVAQKYINYVSGMDAVPVGNLFKKYYTPGLLHQLNAGQKFGSADDIHKMIQASPIVTLTLVDINEQLLDQDSVLELSQDKLRIKVEVASNGIALEEVRIYNNGKLILYDSAREAAKKITKYFDVELLNGRNKIAAVVLNENLVESEPSVIEVVRYGEGALSNLYVISIGINDYKNPNYQLNYALNDAKSYNKSIKQGASSLFNNVEEYFISNDKANKEEIIKQINDIASKAGPEDVFLFYYAGHGVLSKDKNDKEDFYIVTYDVTNIYGAEKGLERAISAEELMNYSMKVKAEKQLFVIDACHSGGALNTFAKRGVAREKAISQLARTTGTVFLSASQDVQYANEDSKLKHGLFTYAIIEALAGKADSGDKDQKITVSELKTYVEDRVPELALEYGVPAQYPTGYSFGQDFPLVIVK